MTYRNLRPSPRISAATMRAGQRRKGNDGYMYYVAVDKNGRQRWVKSKPLSRRRTPGAVIAQRIREGRYVVLG